MGNQIADFLQDYDVVFQAFVATLFTWGVTGAGAALVFFTKRFNQAIMDGMLGMAAGVMVAASYWSLLKPSIEMSGGDWRPATIGFLLGGAFLYAVDKVLPHLHIGQPTVAAEGIHTTWRRSVLLVMAITLHNIPEGLAVGVAFGAVAHASPEEARQLLLGGIALAIGIGLQNFPEGLAVAMPLRREGMGRSKAFFYGQASGVVEPIAGVLGAWAVLLVAPLLPYALAFAAGAMIFVVVEELIPESQRNGYEDFATLGTMAGFAVMMTLDVALG
jgi:ZIP family zinc transporter